MDVLASSWGSHLRLPVCTRYTHLHPASLQEGRPLRSQPCTHRAPAGGTLPGSRPQPQLNTVRGRVPERGGDRPDSSNRDRSGGGREDSGRLHRGCERAIRPVSPEHFLNCNQLARISANIRASDPRSQQQTRLGENPRASQKSREGFFLGAAEGPSLVTPRWGFRQASRTGSDVTPEMPTWGAEQLTYL